MFNLKGLYPIAVMVHAVCRETGDHADSPDQQNVEFNAWLRISPNESGGLWVMCCESDATFNSHVAAMVYAKSISTHYKIEIDEY